MSTSTLARSARWMRAAGIRCVILLTLVLLAFQSAAVFPASRAFAESPSLATVQQALNAAMPQGADVTVTPPPTDGAPPPVDPAVAGAAVQAATPAPAPVVADATPAAAPPSAAPAPPSTTPAARTTTSPTLTSQPAAPLTVAAAPSPAAADPTAAVDPTDPTAPSTSFSVSSAVRSFLAGLNITLPDGPVTGTLSGSTLTVAVGAPALPVTLPIGAHSLSFSGAALTIDEATKSLSLSASATSDNGITAALTVTIAKADSTELSAGAGAKADLSATVDIKGVPALGDFVDLTGTLSYVGGKPAASLTGTLVGDAVIARDALTVKGGSTLSLSTTDGFKIDGSADIGSSDTVFTVGIKGEVHDPQTWSVDVSTVTDKTFSPVDGLTITPHFSGSISRAAGAVSFDVSSDETGSWTTGPATLALKHVEVSNKKPADGLACPAISDGQLWLDVKGSVTDGDIGLNADGEACVNTTDKTFQLTANVPNAPASDGFSVDNAKLMISRDKSGKIAASVGGTLTITAGLPNAVHVPVTLALGADGGFVAAGSVNLAELNLGSGSATVLVSTKAVDNYDASPLSVTGGPVTLPQGVTVLLPNYQPGGDVTRALNFLKLPIPQSIQAQASLSSTGFATTLAIKYGAGNTGPTLLGQGTPGGGKLYLNSISLGVNVDPTKASISVSGSAYLELPALYPGSKGSNVKLTLTGSLDLTTTTVGVKIGFDINAPDGWHDAFGIPDLTVQRVAGTLGVVSSAAEPIPVPTVSFLVKDVQLPSAWNSAIGITAGSKISLSLAMDVNNPIIHVSIAGPDANSVALRPLTFAKSIPGGSAAVNAVEINKAELLFAPAGGKDAAGYVVKPGATLVFDSVIGGVKAHVDGNIAVLPYPSLTANVSVGSFKIGTVNFDQGTTLGLNFSADPTKPSADFMFSGGFTDSVSKISFRAKVDLGASSDLARAAVALSITGGLPKYLSAQADLNGQISGSASAGFAFSASGNVRLIVNGYPDRGGYQDLGNVSFSYSSSSGALWQQLSQAPNVIANTFKQIYGWGDVEIAKNLTSLKFTANDVAKGIGQGLNETNAQVTAALYRAGYTADQTVQAVKAWGNATVGDIANGLNQAGATTDQIVAAAKNAFGNSAATVYNALQSIGKGGESALASVANFFNPGSYYISNQEHWYDFPMYFDVSNASQTPDTHVIQYTWNGGHNQQWYVLPTDSGYAEIVNRNSGQCLSIYGNSAGPAPLVQYPCFGGANQQWYYTGGTANLGGTTGKLWSRSTGLVADVAGESASRGAWIDVWYSTGHNNQSFTFTRAIG